MLVFMYLFASKVSSLVYLVGSSPDCPPSARCTIFTASSHPLGDDVIFFRNTIISNNITIFYDNGCRSFKLTRMHV
jgi:hypothetical protein